jgi:hypothetical protein
MGHSLSGAESVLRVEGVAMVKMEHALPASVAALFAARSREPAMLS